MGFSCILSTNTFAVGHYWDFRSRHCVERGFQSLNLSFFPRNIFCIIDLNEVGIDQLFCLVISFLRCLTFPDQSKNSTYGMTERINQ